MCTEVRTLFACLLEVLFLFFLTISTSLSWCNNEVVFGNMSFMSLSVEHVAANCKRIGYWLRDPFYQESEISTRIYCDSLTEKKNLRGVLQAKLPYPWPSMELCITGSQKNDFDCHQSTPKLGPAWLGVRFWRTNGGVHPVVYELLPTLHILIRTPCTMHMVMYWGLFILFFLPFVKFILLSPFFCSKTTVIGGLGYLPWVPSDGRAGRRYICLGTYIPNVN